MTEGQLPNKIRRKLVTIWTATENSYAGGVAMQLLKDRIRKDGKIKGGNVLKVDSFLNHQMDIKLFEKICRRRGKQDSDH